ncbi:hypothetical protein [Sorangium sp. So ce363]|uniref:hypothetical protein n=1 Tax=Sorangium sp. So ce363 TaxID=3133304 RepID=UPI003F634312
MYHVYVERARRVLGLPGTGLPSYSQPGITLHPPGATTGSAQGAGARLSMPHVAASVETAPTVSSWSNPGQPPRAGRKGALLGLALAAGAAMAVIWAKEAAAEGGFVQRPAVDIMHKSTIH